MANPYPSNAFKAKKEHCNVKIVNRQTKEVVLETRSTLAASRFLGTYDLYIFHCKNGHRKYRPHEKYEVYINDKPLESANCYLNKDALVIKGVISYFNFFGRHKLNIVEFKHNKLENSYELIVKVDDLPNKYLYFVGTKPPTFTNVVNKIKKKLVIV